MKTITPHKGGRSDRLHVRITPGSKLILVQEAARLGISVDDLIEKLAKMIEKGKTMIEIVEVNSENEPVFTQSDVDDFIGSWQLQNAELKKERDELRAMLDGADIAGPELMAENERLRTFFARIIAEFEKNNTWSDIVHKIVNIAREAQKPVA